MAKKTYPCIFEQGLPYEHFAEPVTKEELGGHCDKQFLVFLDDKKSLRKLYESIDFSRTDSTTKIPSKKLSQSEYFAEMFDEAKNNPDCSFVSPFVNLAKSGYLPSHIYALKKEFEHSEFLYNELLGSRLFNFLGVPTVFNIAQRIVEKDELGFDINEVNNLVSVDFLQGTQQYASLSDIDGNCQSLDEDNPLSLWIHIISGSIKSFCKSNNIEITKEQLKKLLDDFCEIYLIRNVVMDDLDFEPINIGVVYDDRGYIGLAPQHDMEYLFKGGRSIYYLKDCLEKTMLYMQEFCPDRLQSVMEQKVSKINNPSNRQHVINIANRCVLDNDQRQANLDIIFQNFGLAEQIYQNMTLNSSPNM